MSNTVITAAGALAVVARARGAGWKVGAITDALGIVPQTIRSWEVHPDRVPHPRIRAAVAALAAKLDRAERRSR